MDELVGLKENVILGHLIPAGTGFHIHQDSEVRISPEALQEYNAEKERLRAARFAMLQEPRPATTDGEGARKPSVLDLAPDE
jgi:DNA-directed RNA polymerase subunit beta'